MAELEPVLADLEAEGEALDVLVAGLDADAWSTPTPATGWTIAHQIGHLAWTDAASLTAATDESRFQELVAAAWADPTGFVDAGAERWARTAPAELLTRWREGRAALTQALRDRPAGTKVPWFGPPMSPVSMATARIMETWAHGEDVADAMGVARAPTTRLRHVAHIGVRTRDFAFAVHELAPPAAPFRVELRAPDGDSWVWGPDDAAQRITGPALDFCLLVTQRRHPDDLDIKAEGDDARRWMTIAQAFAGAPGGGRPPLSDESRREERRREEPRREETR
ncbi:TIGR03084 family metal-binding protein [Tomitella gaofuii]|uniref:TIGR03084 family metal-binding protein n=1 Tax=Tomitella gaofuii TaxID=2760083 RepID=UPI0015FD66CD|nr:TIGR03084 family metal-binding protein [Tomitella gaofuii]